MNGILLGTSAFTAAGWAGTFYPDKMQPRDFLTYYATKFDTVEVDARVLPRAVTGNRDGLERENAEEFHVCAEDPARDHAREVPRRVRLGNEELPGHTRS